MQPKATLTDKIYDINVLRQHGCRGDDPSNRYRKVATPHNTAICKHRTVSSYASKKLKHFRNFATRYGQLTIQLTGFIHLAAAMIWLR